MASPETFTRHGDTYQQIDTIKAIRQQVRKHNAQVRIKHTTRDSQGRWVNPGIFCLLSYGRSWITYNDPAVGRRKVKISETWRIGTTYWMRAK